MKQRLEWQLVPLIRDGKHSLVESISQEISALDAKMELEPDLMSDDDRLHLLGLYSRLESCLLSPCEAAPGPMVQDMPGWKEQSDELRAGLDMAFTMDIEAVLKIAGQRRNCQECPGGSNYPGVGGLPCEFDLTLVMELLEGDPLAERIQFELRPREMLVVALGLDEKAADIALEVSRDEAGLKCIQSAADYLRFWAGKGFSVAPGWTELADA